MPNTPKLPEDVERRFDKRYDHYNPIHDKGNLIPVWSGTDYQDIKDFIAKELATLKAQVRREIEELRHTSIKGDTSFHDFCYSEAITDCLSIPSLKDEE